MVDRQAVLEALSAVHDPCSLLYGNDITFAELGMVDDVGIEGSTVTVRLLLDDPNCLYLPRIAADIEAAVLAVPGVERVVIENRGDDIWTEKRLTEIGRSKLEAHRRRKKVQLQQIAEMAARAR